MVMSVAPTKTNIFITGKSGTGKELVAKAIHQESPRKDKPLWRLIAAQYRRTLSRANSSAI